MTDRITFKCASCAAAIVMDNDNPFKDEDIVTCHGCGHVFGTFSVVRAAMMDGAKAEIDKNFMASFGKKPTWRKG